MMDEQEFQTRSQDALSRLFRDLSKASDAHDFEVDLNSGALTVEFEEPRAKFVVSPNSPVRQIWVSALTRSFKLDWNAERGEFVLPDSGASLHALMADVISQQMGETVQL